MIIFKRSIPALVMILFLVTQSVFGQFKLGLYTGFGISSFEWEGNTSAETLPVGLQAYYALESLEVVSFNFGIDFNYSAIPFSYTVSNAANQELLSRDQSQLHLGALIKVKFFNQFILNPYVRLGAGLYSGSHSLDFVDALIQEAEQMQIPLPEELDVSSALGFNFGGGLDINLNSSRDLALFIEFVYHMNSRELDETGLNILQGVNLLKKDYGYDNFAFLLGMQIGF